jgi:hypothetical protein
MAGPSGFGQDSSESTAWLISLIEPDVEELFLSAL